MATDINSGPLIQIIYQNVRGLSSKINSFRVSLLSSDYDIIFLTETWAHSGIADHELFDDRYVVFRRDRQSRGGGVLVAVKNCYECTGIATFANIRAECVWVKVNLRGKWWFMCALYIPPGSPREVYEEFYDSVVTNLIHENCYICIAGDFNDSALSAASGEGGPCPGRGVANFNNFLSSLNLTQLNHIPNHNGVTLDLVLASFPITISRSDFCLVPEDSHHPSLCGLFRLPARRRGGGARGEFVVGQYNFSRANFPRLYDLLRDTDWGPVFLSNNVEQATEAFYNLLYSAIDRTVPKSTPSRKCFPHWYTKDIILTINRLKRYRKTYNRTGNPRLLQLSKFTRNALKRSIRAAFKTFITDSENSISVDPANFWSYLKKVRSNTTNPSATMSLGGHPLRVAAEGFARYFESVYANVPSTYSLDFLSPPSVAYSLYFRPFDISDVQLAIASLKPKKSRGPDGLPPYIFKACQELLSPVLTQLFNLCVANLEFPSRWKVSKICPILKKGDTSMVENYRPVALLSTPAKIFERLLYERILAHVKPFLTLRQHGFMHKRSTATNLLEITESISRSINSNSQLDVVYTDFSKAFDSVDHDILLFKLHELGFSTQALRFFVSYLSGRQQLVVFNGGQSRHFNVYSGVPQGSNLGPLLFLLLVNDLPSVIVNSSSSLFADDFKIFREVSSETDCVMLQQDLLAVVDWCHRNHLSLNVKKCAVVSYSRKRVPVLYGYSVGSEYLARVDSIRDLGVTFDCRLTFTAHVQDIVSRANRALGFVLRNSSNFSSEMTFKLLFNVYVRSILEYCSIVWGPLYNVHNIAIEKVQKRFLRFLNYRRTGTYDRTVRTVSLLSTFGMQTLAVRREAAAIIFIYKLMHGLTDSSGLLAELQFRVPSRSSRQTELFYLPLCRSNSATNAPLFRSCTLVNALVTDTEVDLFQWPLGRLRRRLYALD